MPQTTRERLTLRHWSHNDKHLIDPDHAERNRRPGILAIAPAGVLGATVLLGAYLVAGAISEWGDRRAVAEYQREQAARIAALPDCATPKAGETMVSIVEASPDGTQYTRQCIRSRQVAGMGPRMVVEALQ